jgi:hypothetical protein
MRLTAPITRPTYTHFRVERLVRTASNSLRCFVSDPFLAISALLWDIVG